MKKKQQTTERQAEQAVLSFVGNWKKKQKKSTPAVLPANVDIHKLLYASLFFAAIDNVVRNIPNRSFAHKTQFTLTIYIFVMKHFRVLRIFEAAFFVLSFLLSLSLFLCLWLTLSLTFLVWRKKAT